MLCRIEFGEDTRGGTVGAFMLSVIGESSQARCSYETERSSPGSVGLVRSSPTKAQPTPSTCRAPRTASVNSLPEIPPPGPLRTPQIERCPTDSGVFRTTNLQTSKIESGARESATRISFKRNTLRPRKDGSRSSKGLAPSPP